MRTDTKIVGEFKPTTKDGGEVGDRIVYLYLETNRKLSVTVEGQSWTLLLPFDFLRSYLNRVIKELPRTEYEKTEHGKVDEPNTYEGKKEVRDLPVKEKHKVGK